MYNFRMCEIFGCWLISIFEINMEGKKKISHGIYNGKNNIAIGRQQALTNKHS